MQNRLRKGRRAAGQSWQRIWEPITQDPDLTLFELRDALAEAEGVKVHHSSSANLLFRLGSTYKKSRWSPPSAVAPR